MIGKDILKKLLQGVLVLTSSAVLGYVVGVFVGRSGPSPEVVAAMIPAVLTLAGGVVIFKSEDVHFVLGPLSVILFSGWLVYGGSSGHLERKVVQIEEQKIATVNAQKDKFLYLVSCSQIEKDVNNYRKYLLDLPPLKNEVFCR